MNEEKEKQMEKLFLEVNQGLVLKNGRLKFGVNAKEIEKKWREFKRSWNKK